MAQFRQGKYSPGLSESTKLAVLGSQLEKIGRELAGNSHHDLGRG